MLQELEKLNIRSGVEVSGVVTKVQRGDPLMFYMQLGNTEVHCTCGFFCPLHENDIVVGNAIPGNVYTFTKPPLVTIPKTKNTIFTTFKKAFKYRLIKSSIDFYEIVEKVSGTVSAAFDYLCYLASKYVTTGHPVYLQYTTVIQQEDLILLLGKWHKDINLRRLYLLGFTNREINSVGINPVTLYEKCLSEGPLQFPQITKERCKDILERLGKELTSEEMTLGLIAREVNGNSINNGWVYTPISELKTVYTPDGNQSIPQYSTTLENKYGMRIIGDNIFVIRYYEANITVAEKLLELTKLAQQGISMDDIEFTNPQLDEQQKKAVHSSLNRGFTVITGFAGTGKTTTIKEIVEQFNMRNLTHAVLSFTGKAVARVNEVVNTIKAMTIHLFLKKGVDKLDYVIIDEISTVNTELIMKLFSHFTILPRFVVIGDKNQLPPIECGNFFQEILKLEDSLLKDCIVHLNKVYRVLEVTGPNGEKSDGIIRNSMEIATGGSTIIPFPNFQIVKGTERTVLGIARSLKFNGISKMNFIVLSPYNKNLKMLNEGCQELYSEGSYTVDSLGRKWYIGDKVMMTVNNYKINVMNGEEGIVTNIYQDCLGIKFNTEEFIFSTKVKSENTMQFIGEEVSSTDETKLDVSTIIHSYAITIHKSQGSEWDYVIIYLGDDESIVRRNFLNKNLLYTSITRAKLCVWIVGNNSLVNKIAETTRCMEYDVLYDLLS